jgi:N,N-dimethylformamidase
MVGRQADTVYGRPPSVTSQGPAMLSLIGYANRLSGRPGDTIEFKVSSTSKRDFRADLVRIVCADPNPDGPGQKEDKISAHFEGSYPSRAKTTVLGSYGRVETAHVLDGLQSFTAIATIWPTLPGNAAHRGDQGIIARYDKGRAGFALCLDAKGALSVVIGRARGEPVQLSMPAPLLDRSWYHVWASFDAASGRLTVGAAPAGVWREVETTSTTVKGKADLDGGCALMLAAMGQGSTAQGGLLTGDAKPNDAKPNDIWGHYNGKLERPALYDRALSHDEIPLVLGGTALPGRVAEWSFAYEIMTADVIDLGPHALPTRLVNCPSRAMTGSNWENKEYCWRHAPEQYAAIHFHDDDIADCGWETDFTFTVPEGLRSGTYAARLTCGAAEDRIPFFVLPPKGKRTADICVLISTFTYIVYGNHARPTWSHPKWRKAWEDRTKSWGGYPNNPGEFRQFGLSTYNFHRDGSGIATATLHRPMLNVRPGYVTYPDAIHGSGLRHFPADTHLTAWLEAKGYDYDVVTDHELHAEGHAAIKDYKVVLTGSHPEYHTSATLDALQAFRDGGGRFCYLGGNGFYWKVAVSEAWPGVVEIRRGEGGIRAWAADPGEYFNAFDGEYGGLWRRNGRPPQNLSGVGFTAQGDFVGSYYKVRTEAKDPRVAWMFKGVKDKKLGDFGLSGRGAAGFELDRTDKRLGTPRHALVVAASEGHEPDAPWVLVPEEMLTHLTTVPGEKPKDLIRADLTFFETPAGGAVFSTGSIAFCGSLPWNNFDNNISRLFGNVLDRFLDPAPFAMPGK